MIKPEKLHFATAGIPLAVKKKGYIEGLKYNLERGITGMEIEFVHGVKIKNEYVPQIKEFAEQNNMLITAHGPYYINLNAVEEEKIEASKIRILDTARKALECGGYSITFHAGFYLGQDPDKVYKCIKIALEDIIQTLKSENIKIWVRPETTGKATQFGSLDELIRLSKEIDMVMPCVDFSHMHARVNGLNGYDNFAKTLETLGNELGEKALKNFHGHVAGIEYSAKGEKRHLNLNDSDLKYKELLKALHDFEVTGTIICESPNIEEDTQLLATDYSKLAQCGKR
jgi:deoxyribonuclease-4